ncbi:MAG: DUF4369 domain-containing protein, partial [Schleiferiaceae bacterium]|nr:DUF4369 domain-containing protein [Schleiferiaceae bacterium]
MKYFTSLFAIILLWSCSQETNSSEESVINLTLLNGDHKTVYLVAQIEEDFDTIYTTPLENGSAVLPYTVKYPELMYLNFDGAARPVQLFVDEDGLDVEIDFINVPPAKVTGSEYHQQLDEFFEIEMSFNTAMQGLQSLRMHAQTDQVVAELLKHKEDSIYANFKNATVNFCKTNGLVGAFVANRRIFDMSYEQGDSIYQNILAEHRGSSEVGTLKEKIEVLKKTRLGEAYTDIAQTNLVGEDLKLEEVIKENEYTLIQFWASWHRPSRINNIALKEVYDQFKT